jgi:hypothetical protein
MFMGWVDSASGLMNDVVARIAMIRLSEEIRDSNYRAQEEMNRFRNMKTLYSCLDVSNSKGRSMKMIRIQYILVRRTPGVMNLAMGRGILQPGSNFYEFTSTTVPKFALKLGTANIATWNCTQSQS